MTLRILLADDHTLLRGLLRTALDQQPDLEVVGEAGDGHALVRLAGDLRPDLVVLDLWMPRLSGLEATRAILEACPRCRVVAYATRESETWARQARRAGAQAFVAKTAPFEELLRAIRTAGAGGVHVTPGRRDPEEAPLGELTARELQVLRRLAEGRLLREIAFELGVSPRTVEAHKANLARKLGVRRSSELIRIAFRQGLTAP